MRHTAVALASAGKSASQQTFTDDGGHFSFSGVVAGNYILKLAAAGFEPFTQNIIVGDGQQLPIEIQLKISAEHEAVAVTADVPQATVLSPDPAQRVIIREETLDANPGRPGRPSQFPDCRLKRHPEESKLRSISRRASQEITASRSRNTSRLEIICCPTIFQQTLMEMDTPIRISWFLP